MTTGIPAGVDNLLAFHFFNTGKVKPLVSLKSAGGGAP